MKFGQPPIPPSEKPLNEQQEKEPEPKKLLIIDDNPEYLKIAKITSEKLPKELQEEIISAKYISSFDEALKLLDKGDYNRVVTDLFESASMDSSEEEEEVPRGLAIYLKCVEKDIPVGILTDGDRHAGSLGYLRSYLMGQKFLKYLIEKGEDTTDWYKGGKMVEAAGVDPKKLFRVLLEKKREQIKFDYEEQIKGALYEGKCLTMVETDQKTGREIERKVEGEEYVEILKKQMQKNLKRAEVNDPIYDTENFIIGRTGTDKLDEKCWGVATERILKNKRDSFYW